MKKSDLQLDIKAIDHIGIRVSDLELSLSFYQLLGFIMDPGECYLKYKSTGLVNQYGLRINLIDNSESQDSSQFNILFDTDKKLPGFTHMALIVSNLQDVITFFESKKIAITEGPLLLKRRKAIFIRDPDGNVIEFNQLL